MSTDITRRRFLKAAGAGAVWITLTSTLGCESTRRLRADASAAQVAQTWNFRSRPELKPPIIDVTTQAHDTVPGYICIAPKNGPGEAGPGQDGAMILDNKGQLVWFRPLSREARDMMDFTVQRYRGESVLTWWEGVHTGYGQGEYLIFDGSYREIARVRAGNGYQGDHHEFLISPRDTALFTIYHKVFGDLSPVGGSKDGLVLDGIAQEVDIETGEVLFEWHSLNHVGLDESNGRPPENPELAFDYFHINSIDVEPDGNLLISSRLTSTVYKVDHETGEVIWRLGGKNSDFEMGPGTRTNYQHDARRQPDGTITIFDNGALKEDDQSRGIVLRLDENAMTATLLREYTHPDKVFSGTQGNVQVLPNGNVFVGWGSAPVLSEFDKDGELLFSASFPLEAETYRAFRFEWSGRPSDDLAMVARRASEDEVTVYASWNGATEVASWQVLTGPSLDQMEPLGTAPRQGFETAITVNTTEPYVGVQALDRAGQALGTGKAVEMGN
ncbi:MAG: arylsulfotransferase family protein [Rubrobacter sp.]|nr:arylsulfotransferase family protein [Rubrobacter sp.]